MTDSSKHRWTASTIYLDMWVDPNLDPRESSLEVVDERLALTEYLRRYRLTLEMKCHGLDAEQLARRSVPPSTMSLLGLIRHMADCERHWFRTVVTGVETRQIFCSETDREGDWNGAVADDEIVEQAWLAWRSEVANAEGVVAASTDLSRPAITDGKIIQLREVMLHMIEEYARHCGHADLLRETIDGRVGQ